MSEHIFTLKGRQKHYKNLKTMSKLFGCQVISYTYFKKEKLYHIHFQKNYHHYWEIVGNNSSPTSIKSNPTLECISEGQSSPLQLIFEIKLYFSHYILSDDIS